MKIVSVYLNMMILLAALMNGSAEAQTLNYAHLGECPTESGQSIKDCTIAYRTFGEMNQAMSNVIVFPTWASGRTEQLLLLVGPGKILDSSKFFIITIDSLSNGVSSSPSNSRLQPRMKFPAITIHDMVVAEHMLLEKQFHLNHVYAVGGISMGGMQTFDWAVSYPDFMDRAFALLGSPKLANYDRILWQTQIDALKTDPAWMGGEYKTNPGTLAQAQIGALSLTTPSFVETAYPGGQIPKSMLTMAAAMDANDHIRQAEAMLALDVSKFAGGSMKDAAARVKARLLIVVSKQDHTVTPQPAIDFATLTNSQMKEFDSPCGHTLPICEMPALTETVQHFLNQ